ncbi:Coiled-coil domain-containing protein 125 [Trichoplax sp. H2]|uniref:Uncharacterized protein n=1 Tax=Trichoplax adhaerens TaxID=10228 RepID=B3S379_TRIAD|nr:hypothetical protein TRIADDRAFT_58626 [Trichoplax adhaerens]EDV22743.1 hypothetical protein TRIADDRAFT_58626 [Trichoplax adhaerens]RDD40546.1 Coiled-coil domain-containing protein 125 [Trichoplax sp. H2]|eukprot:XP_002114609.1 hypothetical protein TRIADDRAFT_58626 [Trichoplax adhaerens]
MSAPSTPSLISEYGLDDDHDDEASGDLGLGMGLKPGALPLTFFDFDQDETLTDDPTMISYQIPWPTNLQDEDQSKMIVSPHNQNHRHYAYDDNYKEKAAGTHDYIVIDHQVDVPTNLRNCSQNKPIEKLSIAKRFNITHLDIDHSRIKEKRRLLSRSKLLSFDGTRLSKSVKKKRIEDLLARLSAADKQIDHLQNELAAYRQQIVSKDGAVKILHSQAVLAEARQQQITAQEREMIKKLKEENGALKWEMELKEKQIMNSEAVWSERFNRVTTENKALLATLESRSQELKRLYAEKLAIAREKDLLASSIKIQNKVNASDEETDLSEEFNKDTTSDELVILGACHCLGENETCICAKAAAITKRDNVNLRKRIKKISKSNSELMQTADAYRKTFEEQLNQNTTLMLSIEMMRKDITFNSSNVKSSLKNKNDGKRRGSTDDNYYKSNKNMDKRHNLEEANLKIAKLRELLNDREEALAHQKLAARILAKRTKELEGTIEKLQLNSQE